MAILKLFETIVGQLCNATDILNSYIVINISAESKNESPQKCHLSVTFHLDDFVTNYKLALFEALSF